MHVDKITQLIVQLDLNDITAHVHDWGWNGWTESHSK